MNKTTQNRIGTSFTVSYPDFPSFTVTPKSFTLIQEAETRRTRDNLSTRQQCFLQRVKDRGYR